MLSIQKLNNMEKLLIKTGKNYLLMRSYYGGHTLEVYTNSFLLRFLLKNLTRLKNFLCQRFSFRTTSNFTMWIMSETRTEDFYFRSSSKRYLLFISYFLRLRFYILRLPISRDFITKNY